MTKWLDLEARVQRMKERNKKKGISFTIEPGKGQTYCDNKPTLYAHTTYESSSVLAGQPCRTWLASFKSDEEAIDFCKQAGIWEITEKISGSTHIDVDVMTAHLPDEDDPVPGGMYPDDLY